MSLTEINGVSVTAPLWRDATPETLAKIIEDLRIASYHYADDSGREWKKARARMRAAAQAINAAGLQYTAIQFLHLHAKPLTSLDDLVDAVLRDARIKSETPS